MPNGVVPVPGKKDAEEAAVSAAEGHSGAIAPKPVPDEPKAVNAFADEDGATPNANTAVEADAAAADGKPPNAVGAGAAAGFVGKPKPLGAGAPKGALPVPKIKAITNKL